MKLQNSVFFDEHFIPGFKRLLDFDFDSTDTVRLIKSIKVLDEQQYAVFLTRDKLLKTHAKSNENGKIFNDNGFVEFKSQDDAKKFEEKFNNLLRDEFDIPIDEKIKLTKAHQINANQLRALLDTIVEVVEIDGGK